MPFGGGSSAPAFNGGTITGPLTIDLSDNPANQRALHVILPSTFDFSVEAFTFEVESQFGLLAFTTAGAVSTKGNDLTTSGGSLDVRGGTLSVRQAGGLTQHILAPAGPTAGFFATAEAGQQSHIAQPAGGVVQDAEARAALNALITAVQNLGFTAA